VPDIETRIVPYRVPNINPADIVKGTAGMASTCTSKYQNYETRDRIATPAKLLRKTMRELLRPLYTKGQFTRVPSPLRSIRAISTIESIEVGTYHFTQVPSPKSLV